MSTTIYNILMHICATAVITVPAYNMMPHRISWRRAAVFSLLLFLLDFLLFPVLGSAINLVAIPLVYVLMVLSSGAHKVVNFYMIVMAYMLTVALNYVIIAALRLIGIDVITLSLSGSIVFQTAYFIFAFLATYIIGRAARKNIGKLRTESYQGIEKIACGYIFACFWVYEFCVLIAASKGHIIEVLIVNALIMTALFLIALIVPAYLIIATKRQAQGEIDRKEAEVQFYKDAFFNLAKKECQTIAPEDFEKLKSVILKECLEAGKESEAAHYLTDQTLEELYKKVYKHSSG